MIIANISTVLVRLLGISDLNPLTPHNSPMGEVLLQFPTFRPMEVELDANTGREAPESMLFDLSTLQTHK